MKLHDPQRPRILHKPAFLSGFHAIPKLQIWPTGSGNIEIAAMLPVQDERFMGKWYTIEVHWEDLTPLVRQFKNNPEEFVMELFKLDTSKLGRSSPTSLKRGVEPQDLNVMELLASED